MIINCLGCAATKETEIETELGWDLRRIGDDRFDLCPTCSVLGSEQDKREARMSVAPALAIHVVGPEVKPLELHSDKDDPKSMPMKAKMNIQCMSCGTCKDIESVATEQSWDIKEKDNLIFALCTTCSVMGTEQKIRENQMLINPNDYNDTPIIPLDGGSPVKVKKTRKTTKKTVITITIKGDNVVVTTR